MQVCSVIYQQPAHCYCIVSLVPIKDRIHKKKKQKKKQLYFKNEFVADTEIMV